jgi:hypothetical protein
MVSKAQALLKYSDFLEQINQCDLYNLPNGVSSDDVNFMLTTARAWFNWGYYGQRGPTPTQWSHAGIVFRRLLAFKSPYEARSL